MSQAFMNEQLSTALDSLAVAPVEWQQPGMYDLSLEDDSAAVQEMVENGTITKVVDRVDDIASELFEVRNPDKLDDDKARSEYVDGVLEQGLEFGTWVHFPWLKSLVRFPDKDDHRELRTNRFHNLVTKEEQRQLYDKRVFVAGLSVGRSVTEALLLDGVGGSLAIADSDRLSPTNLGRVRASFPEVGDRKVDSIARTISTVDPYISQMHFKNGYRPQDEAQLRTLGPDIIFDEVDHLPTKARLRAFAASTGTPLVMVTDLGDRSIVDVERHDLGEVKPFNGKVKPGEFDAMLDDSLSPEQRKNLTFKIVGLRHVTTRMLDSVMDIGEKVTGLPQLGHTAVIGGGLGSLAAREILLGRGMDTGRYVMNPNKFMDLKYQATPGQTLRVVRRFAAAKKS